jgi:hypothetical protein
MLVQTRVSVLRVFNISSSLLTFSPAVANIRDLCSQFDHDKEAEYAALHQKLATQQSIAISMMTLSVCMDLAIVLLSLRRP